MKALRPILLRFKALKTTIDAATAPTAPEISTFYTKLGTVGTDIDAIAGTTAPGTLLPPGAQTPDKLKVYASNVENYIFANLRALLDPFFAKIRAELTGPNSEIRYYCNIGLVLPIQSSSHPTITNPAVMISFKPGDRFVDRRRMLMDALRGWMKVQWKGASALESKMNAHIDSIPLPGSFAAISEFARRSAVSDGNPSGDPKDLASHYCPLDEFAGKMAAVP
ncbi:MAG: hypothetical protein GY929_08260 [Actinomycetia bacterium]|nr:hypothetical protein [Actinomycetes bacterium]